VHVPYTVKGAISDTYRTKGLPDIIVIQILGPILYFYCT